MERAGIGRLVVFVVLAVAVVAWAGACRGEVVQCLAVTAAELPSEDIYAIDIDRDTISTGELIELLANRRGIPVVFAWPHDELAERDVPIGKGRHSFWQCVLTLLDTLDCGFAHGSSSIEFTPQWKPPEYRQRLGPMLDTVEFREYSPGMDELPNKLSRDGLVPIELDGTYLVRTMCQLDGQGDWTWPGVKLATELHDFRQLHLRFDDGTEEVIVEPDEKANIWEGKVLFYKVPPEYAKKTVSIRCRADLGLFPTIQQIEVSSLDSVPKVKNPTTHTVVEAERYVDDDGEPFVDVTVTLDTSRPEWPQPVVDAYRVLFDHWTQEELPHDAFTAAADRFYPWRRANPSLAEFRIVESRMFDTKRLAFVNGFSSGAVTFGLPCYSIRQAIRRPGETEVPESLKDYCLILYCVGYEPQYSVEYVFDRRVPLPKKD